MKNTLSYLFLSMLFTTFIVSAEETKHTQEQLKNACTYLGGFCEIAKRKCALDKALDQEGCLMDYFGNVLLTQRNSQDPVDKGNAKFASEACQRLGNDCDFIQLDCLASGGTMFNSCIAMSYFKIEVAKERCGLIGYKACLKRDEKFSVKIIHELTLPNINKPIKKRMWEECAEAGSYKVKSTDLKRFYYGYMKVFQNKKDQANPIEEDYEHKIQEEYYNCMKAVLEKAS